MKDRIINFVCVAIFWIWVVGLIQSLFTPDLPQEVRRPEVSIESSYKENVEETLMRPSITHRIEETSAVAPIETTKESSSVFTTYPTEKIEEDYYYARVIWNYLRYEMGLNKWCAAGIMGNIMTECGGQTLNIQPYITNSSGHYGICQWSLKYFPEVKGKNIHGQLEFLNSTLRWILNDYGDRYYDGFNYEKFIVITNEREAAKAFAHGYEGCGEYCAPRRLDHATEALRYFEGE